MSAFVYLLRCADGSYYAGSTRDSLENRVAQHNSGYFGGYTKSRRPVELAFSQDFDRVTDAVAAERQIKGWSRAKKEALINRDFDLLVQLAKNSDGVASPFDRLRVRFGIRNWRPHAEPVEA